MFTVIVLLGLFYFGIYRGRHFRASVSMEKSLFTADYQVLRKLLRKKREAAGLTQIDLASRIEETQSYVSKCERGERRLDLVQLRVFCRAIGVSLADFVKEFERLTARARR